MNYYQFNIGDYRRDTIHLSLLEHGIYRQLLDTYYLEEVPLPLDHTKLMRSLCVRNATEEEALENVLNDFFTRTENGYIHTGCDRVIAAYRGKSEAARRSANARWERVSEQPQSERNANGMRTQCDRYANHKPINNNINNPPVSPHGGKAPPNKPSNRRAKIPGDFEPTDASVQWAMQKHPMVDLKIETEKFINHHLAKGSVMADWQRAWMNWIGGVFVGGSKVSKLTSTQTNVNDRDFDYGLGEEDEDGTFQL